LKIPGIIFRVFLILIVLSACGGSVWYVIGGPRQEHEEGQSRKSSRPVVETVVLQPQPLARTLDLIGTIQADEAVEVTTEVPGRVKTIGFEEGEAVKAGDLLVELESDEWGAQLARAEAEFELARIEEQRAKELLTNRGISQAAYDSASAERGVAKAEMQLARARLGKTRITAPFDGVMGIRAVSVGDLLSPGEEVAPLQRIDPIKLEFSLPEEYAPLVRLGDSVDFTIPGSSQAYTATVYTIEPLVDPVTRNVKVRAKAPNPNRTLLPGGFARVHLVIENLPDALLAPPLALIPGLTEQGVFRINGSQLEEVRVQTGLRTPNGIQIRSGLQPGDEIVISGVQQLRDGLEVVVFRADRPDS